MIRYKIRNWARHNTVLEYNAPCQKDTGFFFLPVSIVTDLISSDRCSEMDIVLDLWVSAIYNDSHVQGSALGPVAYFRNGAGNPLVTYTELAARWGLSRATVGRVLKKLSALDYISLMSFPGRHGSVIYLENYLSTMFEISDVMVDKEEVAMTLNIRLELPAEGCVYQEALSAPPNCKMLWGRWISAFILHNQGPMLLNFRKLNRRQLDRISQQYLHISVQTVRCTLH